MIPAIALPLLALAAPAEFQRRCLEDLAAQVPEILASQDPKTGRFGTGIWIVNDQNVVLALAAAWSTPGPKNPHYHSARVLDAILAGGDALIDDQDAEGKWEFRKKDGSTWGKIFMPWTYSRWIRAYALVRESMPAGRRARWDKALRLGYGGIARELAAARLHNIPAHHAMGLYFAGQVFGQPEWKQQAADYLRRIAASQHPDGYWKEHFGPVVLYGYVYVDALGVYLHASKDASVLPVLARSAVFHSHFTYPDGTDVETIDERNPYHAAVRLPNAGFTATPEGRAYAARQLAAWKGRIPADEAALLLLYGTEGEPAPVARRDGDFDYTLGKADAAVRRRGPWFVVASALVAPPHGNRWGQDRQNFVSVFHDAAGLILGGGNTKLQPRWSNFTLGDVSLLQHKPGDEKPNFLAPRGLVHVPGAAKLLGGGRLGVELDYAGKRGVVEVEIRTPERLVYTVSCDPALAAHVTLLPRVGEALEAASGRKTVLGAEALEWSGEEWIRHGGVRVALPQGATLRWPVLPHNPYRKDGRAETEEGRLVIDLKSGGSQRIEMVVGK